MTLSYWIGYNNLLLFHCNNISRQVWSLNTYRYIFRINLISSSACLYWLHVIYWWPLNFHFYGKQCSKRMIMWLISSKSFISNFHLLNWLVIHLKCCQFRSHFQQQYIAARPWVKFQKWLYNRILILWLLLLLSLLFEKMSACSLYWVIE